MNIDWHLVARFAAPIIALFVGAWINRFLEGRPKLITFMGHAGAVRIEGENGQDTQVHTHSVVIRNAGGWVTPAVLRDLAILGVLGANLPGASAGQMGLAVIHHTDCGMARLADSTIQQQVAKRLGLSTDEVAAMAITDPITSVRDEIERLRQTTGTPDQLVVTGLVYDVADGTITEVVPSAPLRVTT